MAEMLKLSKSRSPIVPESYLPPRGPGLPKSFPHVVEHAPHELGLSPESVKLGQLLANLLRLCWQCWPFVCQLRPALRTTGRIVRTPEADTGKHASPQHERACAASRMVAKRAWELASPLLASPLLAWLAEAAAAVRRRLCGRRSAANDKASYVHSFECCVGGPDGVPVAPGCALTSESGDQIGHHGGAHATLRRDGAGPPAPAAAVRGHGGPPAAARHVHRKTLNQARAETAQAQQAPLRVCEAGSEGLADTDLIGKPRSFPSKAEQWAEWNCVSKAYRAAVHSAFRRLLRDTHSLGPTSVGENGLSE